MTLEGTNQGILSHPLSEDPGEAEDGVRRKRELLGSTAPGCLTWQTGHTEHHLHRVTLPDHVRPLLHEETSAVTSFVHMYVCMRVCTYICMCVSWFSQSDIQME